jgi:hypothetical protein
LKPVERMGGRGELFLSFFFENLKFENLIQNEKRNSQEFLQKKF